MEVYWYVFYVKADTENRVVELTRMFFEKTYSEYSFEVFCPQTERYIKDGYVKKPMFPGYVFVETDMPEKEFCAVAKEITLLFSDVRRLLRYEASGRVALVPEERRRLEGLLDKERCLCNSKGTIEGDEVKVHVGPLTDVEGKFIKINRHHRTAQIEITVFGQKQVITVPLEIVHKS